MIAEEKKKEIAPPSPRTEKSTEEIHTLGILLVHGIGAQRRGDTLVQVGGALCKWVEQFMRLQRTEVPLVDTSLTSADAVDGGPARASLYFKKLASVSSLTWKLAESHWAESFPAPSYWEFARWALRILPLAILLHLAPRIRTLRELYKAYEEHKRTGVISWQAVAKLLDNSEMSQRDRLVRNFSESFASTVNLTFARVFLNCLLLPVYAVALLLVQLMLMLFMVVAWLPFDFIKSFAKRVQATLSATVGDSCLFTTNRVVESAIVSRVQRDIEALADNCDRVVVVAHSQGAAVAYQAIEQWTWRRKIPSKLNLLITYGSGLQKLLDLRSPLESAAIGPLGWLAQASSTLLATLTLYSLLLLRADGSVDYAIVSGALLSWLALIGTSIGVAFSLDIRAQLLETDWDVYYASHDPVPNGRIYLAESEHRSKARFYEKMREVVNFGSVLWDHTTYWKSVDSFVARVAISLFERSGVPLHWTTADWLDVCAARRLWRVRYLSACRATAFIIAIAVTLLGWPHLDAIGSLIASSIASAVDPLLRIADGDLSTAQYVPTSLLGEVGVVLAVALLFGVARIGWAKWNSREMELSFWRVGFAAPKVGVLLFGLGWMGLIAFPVFLVVALGDTSPSTWVALGLAVSSALFVASRAVWMGRAPPGGAVPLATAALEAAESMIASESRVDEKTMDEVRFRFRSAAILLFDRGDPEVHVRALQGWEKALDRLGGSRDDEYEDLNRYAGRALKRVRRKKLDDSTLVALLDRLVRRQPARAVVEERAF